MVHTNNLLTASALSPWLNKTGSFQDFAATNGTPAETTWTAPSPNFSQPTAAGTRESDFFNTNTKWGRADRAQWSALQPNETRPLLFAYRRRKGEQYVLGGLVVVLMAVALTGNVVVCLAMAPKLWAGTAIPLNVLVFSLAISDVLKVLLDMLPQAVECFSLNWTMGMTVCKAVSMLRCVFTDISMGTLALISVERFRSVDKLHGVAFSVRSLTVAMTCLWLWNSVCSAPLAVWFTTVMSPYSGRTLCTIPFTRRRIIATYTLITRVTNFCAPLAISWVCYMGIIFKNLKSRARVAHSMSGQQKTKRQRVSRKVTYTCFCLIALYTLCTLPFQLAILVVEYGSAAQARDAARSLKFLWMLSLLKSTANPFLYGLMWENFRKSVKRLIRPCQKRNAVAPKPSSSQKRTTEEDFPQLGTHPTNATKPAANITTTNENAAEMHVIVFNTDEAGVDRLPTSLYL